MRGCRARLHGSHRAATGRGLARGEMYGCPRIALRGLQLEARAEGSGLESLRTALEVAHSQGAKSWELRAAISCARVLRRRGDDGEAIPVLRCCLDGFTEGTGTTDLVEARAVLAELADEALR